MIFKDELDRAGPVVDRVNAAIRENPLAAGLIGAGVAWMLMGGAKGFGVVASAAKGAAGRAGSAAATAGAALASGVANASSVTTAGLKSAADAAGSVASLVPEISVPDTDKAVKAVSEAGATVGRQINLAAAAGREYGAAIQSRLSEGLEKQPLMLGAIGLAIGAGIASTFATTSVEGELMGEQGTAARGTLQGLGGAVRDRAQRVVSELKTEAENQGLTPIGAKRVASDIGEKVKAVAGAGRESVAQSFASKS